jgi:membrane protease YdiL (CAAX protease family)
MNTLSSETVSRSNLAAALPPSPSTRPPGVWMAVGLIALYFLLQFGTGTVLAMLFGFFQGMTHAGDPNVGELVQNALRQPAMRTTLVMASLGVAAVCIMLLAYRKWPPLWRRAQPPGWGFIRPRQPAFFIVAILAGLVAPVLGGLMTQWFAHGHKVTQDIQQLGDQTPLGPRIALVVLVVSLGPVVEELLFRGVLLSALLQRWSVVPSVLMTSALFALVHLSGLQFHWYAVPQLFLLALLLAWMRLHSGSIWPAVVAHGTNNLLAVAAWFVVLQPHG